MKKAGKHMYDQANVDSISIIRYDLLSSQSNN